MNTTNSSDRAILLRCHEVSLKGANRGWFEDKLMRNAVKIVGRALGPGNNDIKVTKHSGRILLHAPLEPQVEEALDRVFGVAAYSPVKIVPTSLESLTESALKEFAAHVERHGLPRSFRVSTKRSEKVIDMSSVQIDHHVGGEINDAYPSVAVDLDNPELTIGLEIRADKSFVSTGKIRGAGGLPVGSNAPLLALMSGGLDSPIAAIKTLRRGSALNFIHFYGTPFVGEEALTKVEDLVRLVNRYQPEAGRLIVVPFGKIQEKIALQTNPKLRTVLYRRMMLRIACRVAGRIGAKALVTGESLGQVASQTVENLSTINAVATMPVIRPLITYDKDEIVEEAHAHGTFATSIRPAADCCTLFADRHPAIRANPETIAEQEARFPLEELMQEALDAAYSASK